jgi:hypothetical protein
MTSASQPAPSKTRFPTLAQSGCAVELTLEERYRVLHSIWRHEHLETMKRIADRFGMEAAIDIAAMYGYGHTAGLVQLYAEKFGLTGQGAAAVAQVAQMELQVEGSGVEVLHETADLAEFKADCCFGDLFQKKRYEDHRPLSQAICNRGCRGWMADMGATVAQDLQVERLAWMVDGAPRCHYRISRTANYTTAAAAPQE